MFKLQHTLFYHPARSSVLFPNLGKQHQKQRRRSCGMMKWNKREEEKSKCILVVAEDRQTTQTKEGKIGSDPKKYQNKKHDGNTQGGKKKPYNQRK
jgi:hypothetical protein